jgi:hypothetical protein
VRATLLLCDGAQAIDGKLYVLGWGWSFIGPAPAPQALALKLDLDRSDLGKPHHLEVFLEDPEGQVVVLEGADGASQTVEMANDFEVPRLPELTEGVPVSVPLALNIPALPLRPDTRYTWRLVIDGESDDSWRVSFFTRPAVPGAPGSAAGAG